MEPNGCKPYLLTNKRHILYIIFFVKSMRISPFSHIIHCTTMRKAGIYVYSSIQNAWCSSVFTFLVCATNVFLPSIQIVKMLHGHYIPFYFKNRGVDGIYAFLKTNMYMHHYLLLPCFTKNVCGALLVWLEYPLYFVIYNKNEFTFISQ